MCTFNQAHVQYQSGTRGSIVKKPAKTQTRIRLAIHSVIGPNSRSGGHEFEFPIGELTKSGKTLGIRSFYIKVSARRVHNALQLGKGECRINETNMPQQ